MLGLLANATRGVLGMNARNAVYVEGCNPRVHRDLADDKLACKRVLERAGVPVPATIAVIASRLDIARFDARVRGHERFAVKPARGKGGAGIIVVRGRGEGGWITVGGGFVNDLALRHHLVDMLMGAFSGGDRDEGFLEELLLPHPSFVELSAGGLPDIRVITHGGTPRLAMLRCPTAHSGGKANLHQGGIGVGVDLESGRTLGGWWRKQRIDRHPDSGAPLAGIQVPFWSDIVAIAERAARAVPLGYLGVDLTCDERLGPLVVELNVRPGLEVQNVTGVGLETVLLGGAARRNRR